MHMANERRPRAGFTRVDVVATVVLTLLALRGKYSDPARSGLTATIKEGENTLPPFQLKTSR
ncbi:hypothetical protein [Singulisphaera sp. GP187]|uniref:hypothetical protein n=1 Tax=Singulisphaera sp. GP187 TaxID=1882752 RepID=UPI0009415409|nr:hypothetical protein [Singulisphaera sp. GP187]